ncbi:alpha-L-fucosidase [Pedobacter frigoris]|uniref:alpha-L-fucosidase n=1 Tax=Pedobacter frigoris TaxID=2571272 RepID=UPI00292CB852|nr:alpha-L-fucosidase [Pedobacter frigoris]
MKKFFYVATAFLSLLFTTAQGQWSVLNTDNVPKQSAYKYQPFTKEQWNASTFASPQQMKWFTEARYGMFIHFGLSAYVEKDISWPIVKNYKAPDEGHGAYPDSVWTKWPSKFKLENFNAREWVQIAKDAGMKYVVVIAKHHDGFHMWDTKFSDFKITNTPFGRDYLKEIADACHAANMPFGFYYSQRDWHHPDYAPVDTSRAVNTKNGVVWKSLKGGNAIAGATHKKYLEYQKNVVTELLTKYGKVDIFWFDAAWWGGMFTADMWDAENLTGMMRKLQPGIIINNRASVPGDFDTPEQQVGRYQKRAWESALTLNDNWAYSPVPNKSKKDLLRELFSCAQGNGNVLMSWGAHWDGRFNPTQKALLLSMGEWLKKYGNAFYDTKGGPWMPGKWGGATYSGSKVYLYVYDWKDGKITLPAIPGNGILKAKFLNAAGQVKFVLANNEWQFTAPAQPDEIATIIELDMKKPVSGVLSNANNSVFEGPEYGAVVKDAEIAAAEWKKGQHILDLKKIYNVTGIGVYNNKNTITVKVSVNGTEWKEAGVINPDGNEISLTTYMTGAEVLGRKVRYLQLNTTGEPMKGSIKVYAK